MTLQFWAEFLVSRFFWIVPIIVGCVAFWWMLRWMRMSTHVTWSESWNEIKKGNLAVAIYDSARILSVGIMVAGVSIAGAVAALLL